MYKVLLFQETNSNSFSVKRFLEQTNSEVEVLHSQYSNLKIEISSDSSEIFLDDGKSIFDFDAYIFRSSKDGKKNIHLEFLPFSIKYLLHKKNKKVLNYTYTNEIRNLEAIKLHNYFVLQQECLPIINTKIVTNPELLDLQKLQFPKILKPMNGSLGQGIEVVKNEEEFIEYTKKYDLNNTLVQDLVLNSANHSDVRIICVGNQILGGMKRVSNQEGSFLTNYSLGNNIEFFEVSESVAEICRKTMKVLGLDYAGVDIIYDKENNPFILEVNSGAQFEGFEKVSGKNVPGEIIEHLLSK